MVAEWLSNARSGPTSVLLVTGDLNTVDHAEKKHGFEEFIASNAPHMSVGGVLENHDQPVIAYQLAKKALEDSSFGAVYVCTANSLPVVKALEETGRLKSSSIVTTDLSAGLVPYIRSGKVMGTVYQRPITQGRMAFQALYQFLVSGTCPPLRHRLAAHLVLRSNIELFLDLVRADSEETDRAAETPGKSTGSS